MLRVLRRHAARIAITLVPLVLALLHATGALNLHFVDRLDQIVYDARLNALLPGTRDDRIVIVAIDEPSLLQLGQWPWSRDKLARLTSELTDRQQVAALGFDVLFAEPNDSAGLAQLRRFLEGDLAGDPQFAARFSAEWQRLAADLDHDRAFAAALAGRPVVLGYYFGRGAAASIGHLPTPWFSPGVVPPGSIAGPGWTGYAASLPALAEAAAAAGFINAAIRADDDGVLRAAPLLARYEATAAAPAASNAPAAPSATAAPSPESAAPSPASSYYPSLAMAVYRLAAGSPPVSLQFARGPGLGDRAPPVTAMAFGAGLQRVMVPVDVDASALVPYRGRGGPDGGSFRYLSAADVIAGKLAPAELRGKIVLVGATAPGLQDLRATPVSATFPGVEVHANIISGLLDGRILKVPDYAAGYRVVTVLGAGLLLAFGLSLLPARRGLWLALAVAAALIGLDTWLYTSAQLVLPLAGALLMTVLAFILSTSWGYLVEEHDRRRLVRLFGTYVPPQLVDDMLTMPGRRFSMRAESRELTVMFCDMRGFTHLSEQMAPTELQALLNVVFSRLTRIISAQGGTVDKYMGDCVMAFWGAPVELPDHAERAVRAAVDMAATVRDINLEYRPLGWPEISVGIGLNTGLMSVGDMGSTERRSYTVVGDAVNLASRIEGLGTCYGVQVVTSEATRNQVPGWAWQPLDRVRVRGREASVSIFTPLAPLDALSAAARAQLAAWSDVLAAWREQDWARARSLLSPLLEADVQADVTNVLYRLYSERLALMAQHAEDPSWDGVMPSNSK